jgi:hypothetical protein
MTRAIAAFGVLSSAHTFAQSAAPSFDAASIKASNAKDESSSWNTRLGYLVMRNQTLNACIRIAYGLKVDQIAGGPKWLDSDRFDIEARATGPAKDPELLAMLQTLLAEGFRLKIPSRYENRLRLRSGRREERIEGSSGWRKFHSA